MAINYDRMLSNMKKDKKKHRSNDGNMGRETTVGGKTYKTGLDEKQKESVDKANRDARYERTFGRNNTAVIPSKTKVWGQGRFRNIVSSAKNNAIGGYRRTTSTLMAQAESHNNNDNKGYNTYLDNPALKARRSTDPNDRAFQVKTSNTDVEDWTHDTRMQVYQDKMAKADTQIAKSEAQLEAAKAGLGKYGQFGVDLAQQGILMGADMALSAVTGGVGGLAAMGMRSFGLGANEAARDGATLDQQAQYGALSAAVETATEKLFQGVTILKGMYGGGFVSEKAVSDYARRWAKNAAKTEIGANIADAAAKMGIAGVGEGLEEIIADAVNPVIKMMSGQGYEGQYTDPEYYKQMARDGLLGGILGGIAGGGSAVIDYKKGGKITEDDLNIAAEEALKMGEDSDAYQKAVEYQQDVEEGKTVTEAQKAELVKAVAQEQNNMADNYDLAKAIGVDFESAEDVQLAEEALGDEMGTVAEEVQAVFNTFSAQEGENGAMSEDNADGNITVSDEANMLAMTLRGLPLGNAKAQIQQLLPGNEAARSAFTKITGLQLPETNQGTIQTVQNYMRTARVDLQNSVYDKLNNKFNEMYQPGAVATMATYGEHGQRGYAYEVDRAVKENASDTKSTASQKRKRVHDTQRAYNAYYAAGTDATPETREAIFARLEKTWAGSGISESTRMKAFEAGQNDKTDLQKRAAKAQDDEKSNAKTTVAKTGEVTNKSTQFTDNEVKGFEELAEVLKLKIVLEDEYVPNEENGDLKLDDDKVVNGFFTGNTLHIFNKSNRPYLFTVSHEFTHYLRTSAPKEYQAFADYVVNALYMNDPEAWEAEIQSKIKLYAESRQKLTRDGAIEEILADSAVRFFADEESIRNLTKANKTLAERLKDFIDKFLNSIKALMGNKDLKEYGRFYDELGILEKASKLYGDAIKAAEFHDAHFDSGGVRFSLDGKNDMSEPVEITDRMIAWHNMGEDAMMSALELGGLAMPSWAVKPANMAHPEFGDISVIAARDTVAPGRDAKIFNGDAWTPTFPNIDYEADSEGLYKVGGKIRELLGETASSFGNLALDPDNANSELKFSNGSFFDAFGHKAYMKYAYLKEKGIKVDETFKEVPLEGGFGNDVVKNVYERIITKNVIDDMNKGGISYYKENPEDVEAIKDLANEEYEDKYNLKDFFNDNWDFSTYYSFVRAMMKYKESGITKKLDIRAMEKSIDDEISKNASDYKQWVNNLFKDVSLKKGIRNNKDPFTPSGNRRSFDQLHYEYSLANVVKAMKQQKAQGGSTGFSGGPKMVKGAAIKSYSSLEEVRSELNKVVDRNKDIIDSSFDEFSNKVTELASQLTDNIFSGVDEIADILAHSHTKSGIYNYFMKEFQPFYKLDEPKMFCEDIYELGIAANELPIEYFEAKTYRAFPFSEAAGIVIPDTASEELKGKLKDANANVITYKAGDEEDRLAKVNSIDNVRFSISKNSDSDVPSDTELTALERVNDNGITYESLVSKPDLNVVSVNENVSHNDKDIKAEGKKNARSKHNRRNTENETYVYVKDIDADVMIPTKALIHRYRKVSDAKIAVVYKIGDYLENSIKINELVPQDKNAISSYILLGYGESETNGYPAYFIVNQYNNEAAKVVGVEVLDKLYSTNAKKIELAANAVGDDDTKSLLPSRSISKISISDLLDIVNVMYSDILPKSVAAHYNHERNESKLGESVKYSITKDSEGRPMTAEQSEYFKDSKARDDQGRLVKVYHGTTKAGFTKFGKTANFYVAKRNVASTYSGNDEIVNPYEEGFEGDTKRGIYAGYVNMKNPLVINCYGNRWSQVPVNAIPVDNIEELFDKYGAGTYEEYASADHETTLRTATDDIVYTLLDNEEEDFGYDGIIFKNIWDVGALGNQAVTDEYVSDVYITKNSNQFKDANNLNPTEDADIRYSISEDSDGNKVVAIDENVLKAKMPGEKDHNFIAEFIATEIGKSYTILQAGTPVYIGDDLPGEFAQSEYTKWLIRNRPGLLKAKKKTVGNIGELIEIAEYSSFEANRKKKHKIDAKYGFYKYATRFAIKKSDGTYNGYTAELLIRRAADKKLYLYDIVDIKKTGPLILTTHDGGYNGGDNPSSANPVNDRISQETAKSQDVSRHSITPTDNADNEKLVNKIDNLKKELKRTDLRNPKQQDVQKLARAIIKDFGMTKSEMPKLEKAITSMFRELKNPKGENFGKIADDAILTANDVMQSITTVIGDQEYFNSVRKTVKSQSIAMSSQDAKNIPDFREYVKANRKYVTLSSNGRPIDTVYAELAELYPELFNLDVTDPSAQLMAIVDNLKSIEPETVKLVDTLNETDTMMLSSEIGNTMVDGLYELGLYQSFADKKAQQKANAVRKERAKAAERVQKLKEKAKTDKEKARQEKRDAVLEERAKGKEKLEDLKAKQKAYIKEMKNISDVRAIAEQFGKDYTLKPGEVNKLTHQLRQAMHKADDPEAAVEHVMAAVDILTESKVGGNLLADDAWDEVVEAVANPKGEKSFKNTYADQIARLKNELAQTKLDYAKRNKDRQKSKKRRETIEKIKKSYERLSAKLQNPTDTNHLPDGFEKAVADFLAPFDFATDRTNPESKAGKAREEQRININDLAKRLNEAANDQEGTSIVVDFVQAEFANEIAGTLQNKRVSELSDYELEKTYQLIKNLEKIIYNVNQSFTEGISKGIAERASQAVDEIKERNKVYKKSGLGDTINSYITSNVKPRDFFRVLTKEGGALYEAYMAVRKAFNRHINNMTDFRNAFERAVNYKQVKAWRKESTRFKLESGQEIRLTVPQIMSLYELNKREQARGHIYGVGLVASDEELSRKAKKEDKGGKNREEFINKRVNVTYNDIVKITSTLTDEQRAAANKLQKIMSGMGSAWGNEASLTMYNFRKFTEEDYFPITVLNTWLDEKAGVAQPQRLRTLGMTKKVTPNANNPLVVDDIFSVTIDHMNKMSMYTMTPELTDFERIWNYKDKEAGVSLREEFEAAYGKNATAYVRNLMNNINGYFTRDDNILFFDKMLSKFKRAKVGASLRVLVQQPTSIIRAATQINGVYLARAASNPKNALAIKKNMQEMWAHNATARWKSWGFYETDTAKSMESIVENKRELADITMGPYGLADNMTWATIWQAVKLETAKKHKDVKKGSDEYWQIVNERFDEIVDYTQVVDSVFHRSQIMRSKNVLAKGITAFMSEPTTTVNMLRTECLVAAQESEAGEKGKAAKRISKVISTLVINGVAVSAAAALVDAMRHSWAGDDDDDEDKNKTLVQMALEGVYEKTGIEMLNKIDEGLTKWKSHPADEDMGFLERWLVHTKKNLPGNINPLQMLPGIKDVFSIIDGYSVERADISLISNIIDSIDKFKSYMQGDSSYSLWYILNDMLGAVGDYAGVPYRNAFKDAQGIARTVAEAMGHGDYANFIYNSMMYSQKSWNLEAEAASYVNALKKGNSEDARKIKDTLMNKYEVDEEEFNSKVEDNITTGLSDAIVGGDRNAITEIRGNLITIGYTSEEADEVVNDAYTKAFRDALEVYDTNSVRMISNRMESAGFSRKDIKAIAKSKYSSAYKDAYIAGNNAEMRQIEQASKAAGLSTSDFDSIKAVVDKDLYKIAVYDAYNNGDTAEYNRLMSQAGKYYRSANTARYGIFEQSNMEELKKEYGR